MLEPMFLQASAGRLYTSCFLPSSGRSDTWLLFCPPWAEEMNKSRRMMARLGHALAQKGIATCLPDLYGTGDSAGDFSDARWQIWHADLLMLSRWLAERGCKRLLLGGLRAGCLLAMEIQAELAISPDAILLWQPVTQGSQQLTQFLRLRMAAALADGGSQSVKSLREQLAAGQSLEIAGYALSPELAEALDRRVLQDMQPEPNVTVHWLEIGAGDSQDLSPVSRQLVETWQTGGADVRALRLPGDPFWTTQELVDVPELIERSVAALTGED